MPQLMIRNKEEAKDFQQLIFRAIEQNDFELAKILLSPTYFLDSETVKEMKVIKIKLEELRKNICLYTLLKLRMKEIEIHEFHRRNIKLKNTIAALKNNLEKIDRTWKQTQILNFQQQGNFLTIDEKLGNVAWITRELNKIQKLITTLNHLEVNSIPEEKRIAQFTAQLEQELQSNVLPVLNSKSEVEEFYSTLDKAFLNKKTTIEDILINLQELGQNFLEKIQAIHQYRWKVLQARLVLFHYTPEESEALHRKLITSGVTIVIKDPQTGNNLLQAFLLHLSAEIDTTEKPLNINKHLDEESDTREIQGSPCKYEEIRLIWWQLWRGISVNIPQECFEQKNHQGQTVLDIAKARHEVYIFLDYLPFYSSPELIDWLCVWRDKEGNTLLHRAMDQQNEFLVYLLLNHGAAIDAQNNAGKTPWQIITQYVDPGTLDYVKPKASKDSSAKRIVRNLILFSLAYPVQTTSHYEEDISEKVNQHIQLLARQEGYSLIECAFYTVDKHRIQEQKKMIARILEQWIAANIAQDDTGLFQMISEVVKKPGAQYAGLRGELIGPQGNAVMKPEYAYHIYEQIVAQQKQQAQQNAQKEQELAREKQAVLRLQEENKQKAQELEEERKVFERERTAFLAAKGKLESQNNNNSGMNPTFFGQPDNQTQEQEPNQNVKENS